MTKKLLQRRMQKLHTLVCKTQLTLITAAYLHSPIYTQADLVDEVCAHVDLKQIMSTVRCGYHISFSRNGGSTGLGVGVSNIIGQVQDHTVCQGDRMGVESRNVELCLLKHPGHYGLMITLNIHECHF